LLRVIEEGAERLANARTSAVLVDLRAVARIGPTEHMILSHHCGQHLRGVRLAIVVDESSGDGQELAERMGATIRVFEHLDAAENWLLGPAQP
jgi:hypothetical protein